MTTMNTEVAPVTNVTIDVDSDTAAKLTKPVNGTGGYQTILRKLSAGVAANETGATLTLDQPTVDRLLKNYDRSVANGKKGGWQSRFKTVAESFRAKTSPNSAV